MKLNRVVLHVAICLCLLELPAVGQFYPPMTIDASLLKFLPEDVAFTATLEVRSRAGAYRSVLRRTVLDVHCEPVVSWKDGSAPPPGNSAAAGGSPRVGQLYLLRMSSLGCYFTASGRTFDVDSFLARTSLDLVAVFYRGEPLRVPKGKLRDRSGFSVTISHTKSFGDLKQQIPRALRFLRAHKRELSRLSRFPGVSDLRLVFPCCRPEGTCGVERFPAELFELAGSRLIAIELSFYPGDK